MKKQLYRLPASSSGEGKSQLASLWFLPENRNDRYLRTLSYLCFIGSDIITPSSRLACQRRGFARGRYQRLIALAFPTIVVPNVRTLPLPLVFHPRAESNTKVYNADTDVRDESARRRAPRCERSLFTVSFSDSFA